MRNALLATALAVCLVRPCPAQSPATFTRLLAIRGAKVLEASEPYPGDRYSPRNLLDENSATEYSSNGKGTNTFVLLDFGKPTRFSAFRHVDRNDVATVAGSELVFLDAAGAQVATLQVKHVNERAGVTTFVFASPIEAQQVRWRVTRLGARHTTVGGAELSFFSPGASEPLPTGLSLEAQGLQLLERGASGTLRPVKVTLDYPYAQTAEATLRCEGANPVTLRLQPGRQTAELRIPGARPESNLQVRVDVNGRTVATRPVALKAVRKMEIFILPHSHVDIGYTALQADVEKKQESNLETGLRLAEATANYPAGSQFKWNVEVLWPVDNYLRANPQKRAAFIQAVKSGKIGLDAFYGNILTGLCRPEELLNLMGYATRLSQESGVPIDSAMISDVPGYTWSTVSAMAQAGVRYFSFAPNYFDRMGGTMKEWQNRPFWWQGADGRSKVLCWCPSRGYALGHLIGDGEALARFIPSYLVELETNSYPYDISHLRWNVHGDNGSPDEKVSDVVRNWNARYAWPRLTITTTSAAFHEFERRYGNQLPVYSGDYTPYWEDGAASSAYETALNRASAERLVQAETLWSMRKLREFPAARFQEAWRNILLYSEHTWGAHNSISQPDLPFVRDQWKVKQAFALDAGKQSEQLLAQALGNAPAPDAPGCVDVFNTSSWERTDLVTLSAALSSPGDRVLDNRGKAVSSQRLSTGELVFLARGIPPFSTRRFQVVAGVCPVRGRVSASAARLQSPEFLVELDEQTGGIKSLLSRLLKRELVDSKSQAGFNEYFYLPGSDVKGVQRNGKSTVRVKENGPLIASVVVESEAPGCKRLLREIRLIDGLDRVEMINTVDKLPVRAKEGLHFGYGFNVPNGTIRMDVGWAVVRPEADQIPAACKNWFSVQRWVDVSNDKFGITWSPMDAPLVELGGLTANLVGSQTDWRAWIQHLEPTQTLYSWVMNNHWHTNYRADQEGPTVFRYAICAHREFEPEAAARFGTGLSQPLLVAPATAASASKPALQVSGDDVLVTALKPSDDGKSCVVRLFGASGERSKVRLSWAQGAPRHLWLSDLSEQPKQPIRGAVEVPAWGIVTLRAEW